MLPLNNNVEREEVQNILNQIGELYTLIGDEVILYPLKIVSGIVNLTETGEQPLNYDTKDFTSNIGIITSNAPIVCYWEGAFKSKKPDLPLQVIYQEKIFSAENGRKIKTWICGYTVEQNVGSAELNNNTYTTIMLNRNIRSFSRDWNPDDNEMRNYLYLYLDKKCASPQFLRLIRKEPRFIPSNNKFVGCDLEFVNLNIEYSQSGKDIFNFVKMTNPGGNYAFPKELETDSGVQVVLDSDKLNNRGVKDIQLEFNSPYALNSINIIGRLKDNQRIYAPRKLLLINPHPAITSAISVDGSSLNNYYACFEAKPKYQSFWKDWHEKYEASYNFEARKTFNGGLEIDFTETQATNPSVQGGGEYEYSFNLWLNWVINPDKKHTYHLEDTPFCVDTIEINTNSNLTPADFLNMNSFINYTQECLPLEWGESQRGTISDYGLLGKALAGFIQTFSFGYSPGWITNNTWVPVKPINLLIPCTTYWMGKTITTGTTLNPVMFDVFDDNYQDFSASGNISMLCGYRFELTHLFQDNTQVKADQPEGKGGSGIWDTQYLGQTRYENGEWINEDHSPVLWNANCRAYAPIDIEQEYEVDLVCYQGVGKGDCRMTFSAYQFGDPIHSIPVYETRQQTNAKFKNDFHLWRNLYRLNYSEEMNNEGYINYPADVLPPSPQPSSIEITEAKGVYNTAKYIDSEYQPNRQAKRFFAEGIDEEGFSWYGSSGPGHYFQYKLPKKCRGKVNSDNVLVPGGFEIDLTRKIGIDKLDNYSSFKARIDIIGFSGNDYSTQLEINIDDLTDNTWTPIRVATIEDIKNYSGGNSFPNNQFHGYFQTQGWKDTKARELLLQTIPHFANASSDSYLWVKLNKTTQVLTIGFDNPEDITPPANIPKTMYRNYDIQYLTETFDPKWVDATQMEYSFENFFNGYRITNFVIVPRE